MTSEAGGRRGKLRRAAGFGLVAVLALAGAAMLVAAFNLPAERPPMPAGDAAPAFLSTPTANPTSAPTASPTTTSRSAARPPAQGAEPGGTPAPSTTETTETPTATPKPTRTGEPPSIPMSLTIPRIGVNTRLMQLGLNKDKTIQVPTPDRANFAGWYKFGPSPGEIGNTVIVGHVDSVKIGRAVFFRLGELRPGDLLTIVRKDGLTVPYKVDGVKAYPKSKFPTDLVYGDSDRSTLRLVTCGGPWSKATSYQDNIIVFATQYAPARKVAGK
ncbi:class F sortase [Actinopolymorpha cephalotaxi]|uniref:Sortase (Surface protein transpeptidase) n=1 Tax=Actinopolymorpha cephalotaxi TaxID=504797 RepID=A0ABX2S563_9ACTN|nr:class F sortase [Actinopolymorpha cephalotaxi]NYH83324.1 sortase (surface protein transpeptidase) [Actinopolymorpha cephalotaxi]